MIEPTSKKSLSRSGQQRWFCTRSLLILDCTSFWASTSSRQVANTTKEIERISNYFFAQKSQENPWFAMRRTRSQRRHKIVPSLVSPLNLPTAKDSAVRSKVTKRLEKKMHVQPSPGQAKPFFFLTATWPSTIRGCLDHKNDWTEVLEMAYNHTPGGCILSVHVPGADVAPAEVYGPRLISSRSCWALSFSVTPTYAITNNKLIRVWLSASAITGTTAMRPANAFRAATTSARWLWRMRVSLSNATIQT